MGRRSRPAPQRPLAHPDRLSDRAQHRCALAEPALSAGHRTGVLLQENCRTPTAKGSSAGPGSAPCVLVAAVLYGIVPGIVKVGGWFELLFVNGLGMPFNTGVIVYISSAGSRHHLGYVRKLQREEPHPHEPSLYLLTIAMLGIPFYGHGASSCHHRYPGAGSTWRPTCSAVEKLNEKIAHVRPYHEHRPALHNDDHGGILLVCPDRDPLGTANTPMDQNSPEDIFTLGEYLGREQYGTRPLFYGPAYSSKVALDVEDGYCVPRQ